MKLYELHKLLILVYNTIRKQPLLCGVVLQVEMGLRVARMKENRNAHRVLVRKHEGKKTL